MVYQELWLCRRFLRHGRGYGRFDSSCHWRFCGPIFAPLGFGNWQSTVATVLGLVAKEEVVGVFGVLYGVAGDALELVEEGAFNELGSPLPSTLLPCPLTLS